MSLAMAINDVTSAYQAVPAATENRGAVSRPEQQVERSRPSTGDVFISRAQSQADAVEVARREESERRTAQTERRDEFVQSNIVTRNAVYNVTNVVSGGLQTLQRNVSEGQYGSSGERIKRKIIDILLPLGRKNLSIYSTEP